MLLNRLLLLLVLAGLAVPATAQESVATPSTATETAQPVILPGGRLEEIDGMPVVFLYGSAKERAFAEGFLLVDHFIDIFENFALSGSIVPIPGLWDMVIKPATHNRFDLEQFRPHAKAVLEGAEKARGGPIRIKKLKRNLDEEDLMTCICIPDLAGLLCSSFSAWGALTAGDNVLVGRNLDYMSTDAFTKNIMVKVHAPLGKRRGWVSVGWPGLPGCVTGISDAGVFVAIHDVRVRSEKGDGKYTPRMAALKELVETLTPAADTGEAAARILRQHRYGFGGNAMVAWQGEKARGAAVLEFDGRKSRDGGATARGPEKGVPFVACSNHHRLRSKRGHGCNRFEKLMAGPDRGQEKPLDFDAGWRLISRSSVRMTLYRTMADLGSGRLEIDRKTGKRSRSYAPRVRLNVKDVLSRAKPLEVASQR